MKQKWLNLNLGQKAICVLQVVLIVVFAIVYVAMQIDSPGLSIGILLCIINVFSVLYADELFRWKIRNRVADPKTVIPSKAELGSRWVGWAICTGVSFLLFVLGLTGMGL